VDDPAILIDADKAASGEILYRSAVAACVICHGPRLENSGSFAPDLRESMVALDWNAFKSVVHEGSLSEAGTPKFDNLAEGDLKAIYMYVRQRARAALSASR